MAGLVGADDTGNKGGGWDEPLTEKALIGLHKMFKQRTQFIEFLLRQVANVTYDYNCLQVQQLVPFARAMEAADLFRSHQPLKKSEEPRVWCFKVLLDTADAMEKQGNDVENANILRQFINMSGRLRCITGIAGEFIKVLEKSDGDPDFLFKAKYYLDHWKGFCVRTYDFAKTPIANPEAMDVPESLENDQETMEVVIKYLPWLLTVRTALFAAAQYLRRVSLASSVQLFPKDPTNFRKHMLSEQFVTAHNVDDALFQRSQERRLSTMFGIKKPEVQTWTLPNLADIDSRLISGIDENGIMLVLPDQPFQEKKKGKGGKGGKGKKKK